MKKLISTAILLAMFATFCTLKAQTQKEEYLGLPGDNLNLYAVMKLFQESETLEGFERNLNDENSRINNLDLNSDNYVDYIKVIDYVDGEVHNIVLQVSVNARENQDVAVFTVQRFTNGQVQIQLIGDENLYGRNYIIEPIYNENIAGQTPNPGYMGNSGRNVNVARTTTYEIATWPVIRFIYLPSYRVWHSSWYWDYYPSYWHPWKPYYYHYYYGYHYNSYNDYYRHYRRWDRPRYSHWNDFYYTGYRSHSTYVSININKGSYKTTYSRPEERRRGEALYESTRVSQNSRRSDQSTVNNNNNRRSSNQVVQSRQATGNNTSATRRTTTTTRNSGQVNSSGQNSNQARRTTTPNVQNRSSEQAVSRQTNSGARRSTTTQTKSSAQPSSGQNTSTVRRTSTTVNRPATTPSSSQGNNSIRRTTTSTTVKQQAARPSSSESSAKSRTATRPTSSSSKATSKQNSNTSSSSKSSERKKAAEPTSSSRRK